MSVVRPVTLILLLALAASHAFAAPTGTSYTGTLATDDAQQSFSVTLPAPGPLVIRTYSYAGGTNQAGAVIPAGGFDPTVSLFDSAGNLLVDNRDGGCGNVSADPVSKFCWDAYLAVNLPVGTYTVVVTQSENLPNGPTLSSGFVYTGQPTFTAPAATTTTGFWDLFPSQRTNAFALDILGGASTVTSITSGTPPGGTVGTVYGPFTFTAQAAAGATLSWSISSGSLPAGLTLNAATGVLSGTPTASGPSTFTVQVTDGALPAVTQTYTISIAGTVPVVIPVTISPLSITSSGNLGGFVPAGKIAGTFAATGGAGAYKWTATGLPASIALNSQSGAFSGTVGTAGVYSFSIQVADSETPALTATQTVTYSVLGIAQSNLPNGTANSIYATTITGIGGTGPYTFAAAPGSLPSGLTLSSAGVFGGTPSTAGTYTFSVQVSSGGLSTSPALTLTINAAATQPLTVLGTSLASGSINAPYASSQSLQASGGTPPYSWSVFGGVLPTGMSLTGGGTLVGTPTAAGTYPFTAQVTDSKGLTATGSFTVVINAATLTLTLGSFPTGVVNIAYPTQILTPLASGGLPPYTFTVVTGGPVPTQGLPAGLTLSGQQISGTPTAQGTSNFSIMVTDAAGKTATALGSITINSPQTNLILSQASVSFSLTAGASGVPTPGAVTVRSSDPATVLSYSYNVPSTAPWLDVSGGSKTPGVLAIAIDPSAPTLPASSTPYSTVITITCLSASCAGSAVQTVNVSLTVSAPPPQLTLSSTLLSFNSSGSAQASSSQTLGLQNTGGGVITVNSITPGATWLTVTGVPSTLTAGPGATVTVTANPAGLNAGYYTTTLTVNSSADTVVLPVNLLVTPQLTMTLGPAGTQYSAPEGSSPGNSTGSFGVSVTGTGTANWSASVVPAQNWLTVNTPTGSSTAASAGTVSYSLNSNVIASLASASYYATIQVSSPDVVDTTQQFQIVLNITPAAVQVTPVLSSAGLVFTATSAGITPPVVLQVYTSSDAPTTPYQASATTTDGANWLFVSPTTGVSTISSPGQSTVSVNIAGLAAGIYSGGVSYAFASDAVRTVNVTLLVTANGVASQLRTRQDIGAPAACTPGKLIPTQTGLYGNFAQPAGWPTPLSVNVINDCGSPVNGANLTTTFSNGDPPLALSARDTSSGIYLGTWTPRNPAPQVTVTATAVTSPFSPASTQVTGQVRTNVSPVLNQGGTLDVFNPVIGAGLAPGQVVQIYGSNLAASTIIGPAPLSTSLSGTSVLIGGIQMPLYYVSPGQIDAQIPFELKPGTQYQMIVNANNALSTPIPIELVAAAPGIANLGGVVIAQHGDYSLVTSSAPAQPGEYIVLYLSGLGQTDNPVADGAFSPSTTLSHPLITPTLTLNGATIPTAFVGLTPGAVGLYQINFQVPANTPNGNLTLSVSQNGAASNSVTLPVHN